jgi:hypothetical protein
MRSHKRLRHCFTAVALLALTPGVLWFAVILAPSRNARRLLYRVLALRIGGSSFQDVQALRTVFEGFVLAAGDQPPHCSADGCALCFSVENVPLQRLHLAPRLGFFAILDISDDKLTSRYVGISYVRQYGSYEVFVDERQKSPSGKTFRIAHSVPSRGLDLNLLLTLHLTSRP